MKKQHLNWLAIMFAIVSIAFATTQIIFLIKGKEKNKENNVKYIITYSDGEQEAITVVNVKVYSSHNTNPVYYELENGNKIKVSQGTFIYEKYGIVETYIGNVSIKKSLDERD